MSGYAGSIRRDKVKTELRKPAASQQDLLMITTAVPSLTGSAQLVRGQQQPGWKRRPILARS
jgi:hypothetical protein